MFYHCFAFIFLVTSDSPVSVNRHFQTFSHDVATPPIVVHRQQVLATLYHCHCHSVHADEEAASVADRGVLMLMA